MSENLLRRQHEQRDPRTALAQDKYFTLRPQPLERWIWERGLAQAAERVFWVHWEEGMRAGNWCSQLSLRRVAQLCCVDPSTVTRAYQQLKAAGLILREDPGRDPANPFRQATALTEVRLPRELLGQLAQAPNRSRRSQTAGTTPSDITAPALATIAAEQPVARAAETPLPAVSMRAAMRVIGKLSASEKAEYDQAWCEKRGTMAFDEHTTLNAAEQRVALLQLQAIAQPVKTATAAQPGTAKAAVTMTWPRRLTPLEAARLRKRVGQTLPGSEGPETFRQILWAVEEGALRRFEPAKAVNIALKKLREGAWTRPNRMPPQWRLAALAPIEPVRPFEAARPETCSGA